MALKTALSVRAVGVSEWVRSVDGICAPCPCAVCALRELLTCILSGGVAGRAGAGAVARVGVTRAGNARRRARGAAECSGFAGKTLRCVGDT